MPDGLTHAADADIDFTVPVSGAYVVGFRKCQLSFTDNGMLFVVWLHQNNADRMEYLFTEL